MKYCPNCGEPLTDDALFCPECGEKLPEQAAPAAAPAPAPAAESAITPAPKAAPEEQPKKKSSAGKKIAIIAAIVLGVLLAAAAVLYFTGAYRSLIPDGRMKLGLAEKALVEKKLDDAFRYAPESNDIVASLDVTASLEDDGTLSMFDEWTYYKMIIEKLAVKVNIDATGDHFKLGADVNYANSPMLNATVISDNGRKGIYIPQLDSNYYVMSDEAFSKLLSDGGDMQIGLDSIDLTPLDEAKTRKEVMELLEVFCGLSTSDNTVINDETAVTLFNGDKAVVCTQYVVTPTPEQVRNVLNAAAEKLESEDSYLGARLNGLYGAIGSRDTDGANTVSAEIRKLAEDYPDDAELVIEVYMDGDAIISQRVTYNEETCGYDHTESETEERTYFFGKGSSADIVTEPNAEDKLKGSAHIVSEYGDETEITFDFDMLKRTAIGTYVGTATVVADGQEMMTLTVEDDAKNTHLIRVNLGEEEGITAVNVTAEVTEGEGVSEPTVVPVDISDKSPEEISDIFEHMLSQLSTVLLGGIFGGLIF